MNDTQCLRSGHPRLVLSQSIQSLENCLNLALPQQLLRKLLCSRLRYIDSRTTYRCSALTEPPLFYLFGREGKHREQFNRYLDDYVCHYLSGRHRRIDLETFQEIRQALKKV